MQAGIDPDGKEALRKAGGRVGEINNEKQQNEKKKLCWITK